MWNNLSFLRIIMPTYHKTILRISSSGRGKKILNFVNLSWEKSQISSIGYEKYLQFSSIRCGKKSRISSIAQKQSWTVSHVQKKKQFSSIGCGEKNSSLSRLSQKKNSHWYFRQSVEKKSIADLVNRSQKKQTQTS